VKKWRKTYRKKTPPKKRENNINKELRKDDLR